MKIIITDIDSREYYPENIYQITMTDTAEAACSSLCFRFKSKPLLSEISDVKAYDSGRLIFNGYCDCQKITADDDGYEIFIYARSSACILVDNQSEPFTFNCPSARQLWAQYARDKGFKYKLGDITCAEKYEVSSGTSCYGAINNFVSALTGNGIYISPYNEISVRTASSDLKNLDNYNILSACCVINRSEPVSVISYKREQDTDYRAHIKSRLAEEKKISRRRFVNLNSLPQWQRENTVYQKLKDCFDEYMLLEITVAGKVGDELFRRFSYSGEIGSFTDYILTEKKYTLDESGERTKLILKKAVDIGDITYVD